MASRVSRMEESGGWKMDREHRILNVERLTSKEQSAGLVFNVPDSQTGGLCHVAQVYRPVFFQSVCICVHLWLKLSESICHDADS